MNPLHMCELVDQRREFEQEAREWKEDGIIGRHGVFGAVATLGAVSNVPLKEPHRQWPCVKSTRQSENQCLLGASVLPTECNGGPDPGNTGDPSRVGQAPRLQPLPSSDACSAKAPTAGRAVTPWEQLPGSPLRRRGPRNRTGASRKDQTHQTSS
ncbi:hypothetical protein AVEN_217873-1 [Araneus ventricosus]|uniref:Uncharacterized protein n=1 Tax=Araneus ventricosus TaxID=182803 RepID=A0A4Y2RPI9_ARAVE|nr:hypothetical protein AVEN_217873-1 [Araneus ventricosus]